MMLILDNKSRNLKYIRNNIRDNSTSNEAEVHRPIIWAEKVTASVKTGIQVTLLRASESRL